MLHVKHVKYRLKNSKWFITVVWLSQRICPSAHSCGVLYQIEYTRITGVIQHGSRMIPNCADWTWEKFSLNLYMLYAWAAEKQILLALLCIRDYVIVWYATAVVYLLMRWPRIPFCFNTCTWCYGTLNLQELEEHASIPLTPSLPL